MRGINKVILIGHLGKDPEIMRLESGSMKASFTVATTETYKDKTGNRVEQTEWHNIVVWNKSAEIAEKYLKKGGAIYIEGRIRSRDYTDKNNVQRRFYEIVADKFNMLDRKPEGTPAAATAGALQQKLIWMPKSRRMIFRFKQPFSHVNSFIRRVMQSPLTSLSKFFVFEFTIYCTPGASCNMHLLLISSPRIELLIFVGSILVLLWLSFLISGGEHALFSITPRELNQLEKNSPRIFKNIQHLIVRPRHLLVLVRMLQMIINVTILFLAAKTGMRLFHGWSLSWIGYILEIIFLILLLLMFQEIIPKYFAGKNNLLWAKWIGTPLYLFSNLFIRLCTSPSNRRV